MADADPFDQYVEALSGLATVDGRRRDALRKAVESAGAAGDQAKARTDAQQRMYDRAAKDAADADRVLEELREMLGTPRVEAVSPSAPADPPPTLAELRARIDEVARWAADKKPVAESLLRTKARLAAVPEPTAPPPPAPRPPAPAREVPTVAIVAAVIFVVVLIVVIALIAH